MEIYHNETPHPVQLICANIIILKKVVLCSLDKGIDKIRIKYILKSVITLKSDKTEANSQSIKK
jgi:hypothetical protein